MPHLERGSRVDAKALRAAMEAAFGGSDASGAWDWKMAYDACEAALVLFLRKYGNAILRKAGSAQAALLMLERVAELLPTHTRRLRLGSVPVMWCWNPRQALACLRRWRGCWAVIWR